MGNCQQIQNLKENELKINSKEHGIFIAVKIWSKKSNELFNYEARTYKELKYDLMKQETLPKQLRHLFWRNEDDGLMIFNPNRSFSNGNDKLERSFLSKWVNLSSLDREKGIEIQVNDVYKFGNTLLKVKDIHFDDHQTKFNNSFEAALMQCCCNQNAQQNTTKKSATILSKSGNISEHTQYSKLPSDKSCQKQNSQVCQNPNGKCQRCNNTCNNGNNNWLVMQKATTMMLSSKYQGTEECNDDFDQSYFDSNCAQCNAIGQQSENQIGAAGAFDKQSGQPCNHGQRKSKKSHHYLHTQGEVQRQCKICLQTEDEDKSYLSVDQMWQTIQKQNEDQDINNLPTANVLQQQQPNNKDGHDNNHSFYFTNYHQNNNNPLISICGCQGSMKYVHLKCLQTWVKSKQQLNDAFSSKFCEYYSHKAMICELCKKNYPLKININGQKVFLLQMDDDDLEEGTKVMYPASTASRQESNVNQQSAMMRQNSHGNILQIDNEDDDNHNIVQNNQDIEDQEDDEEEYEDNQDNANNNADNDEEEEEEEDYDEDVDNEDDDGGEEEEEEQKTNWDHQSTHHKKRDRKKKNKNFENYVIFEISNSTNTSLNGLIILNLQKSYENSSNASKKTSTFTQSAKKKSTLKTCFTLGRQNSCDIKVNDITVSRFHAELNVDYEKGRVLLKDTNSKFGTLIKLRKELVINTKLDGVQVQINNVCLEFCIGQDPSQEFYQRQVQSKGNPNINDKSSICKFSSCCKTTNVSRVENEININDINFKFRDKEYNPIHQLHDSVYQN